MQFVSRFRREPFSPSSHVKLSREIKTLSQKAEEMLRPRIVKPDRLGLNYETYGIMDLVTGDYFSGKFLIQGDNMQRVVKVVNGVPVFNLVRLNTGEKIHADIIGHNSKFFKTNLSQDVLQKEVEKMKAADQLFYDKMVDRFERTR